MRGNYSVSIGIPLSCYKLNLLKHLKYNTQYWKKGENGNSVLYILSPIHLLISDSVASPQQYVWYAKPGQVLKAGSLPILKTRQVHFVSHWYNHLAAVFVSSIGLEDIIAHIEALTKFTQQVLNDSQQTLPLLKSKMSLIKRLPSKIEWLWTSLLPCKEGPVPLPKQNVECSYLMNLLICYFY